MAPDQQWISHLFRLVCDHITLKGSIVWDEFEGEEGAGFEVYPALMRMEDDHDTWIFSDMEVDILGILGVVENVRMFQWDADGDLEMVAEFAGNKFMIRLMRRPPEGTEPTATLMLDGSIVDDDDALPEEAYN